jgi:hypothetical protein
VSISSHGKLLSSKATVVNVAETSGHDPGRHGRPTPMPIATHLRGPSPTGLSAIDRGLRPDKFAARAWPDDRDVPFILRGSWAPMIRDDAPAIQAVPPSASNTRVNALLGLRTDGPQGFRPT